MTTAIDTYQALLAAVCAEPANHTHKLVLADYLDDVGGYEQAEAWRWIAAWQLVPDERGWFSVHTSKNIPRTRHCDIPSEVFNQLPIDMRSMAWRGTHRQNYLALLVAFWQRRKSGWTPQWPDSPQR